MIFLQHYKKVLFVILQKIVDLNEQPGKIIIIFIRMFTAVVSMSAHGNPTGSAPSGHFFLK